ncbi:glutamyl-tRNA reductase [Chloroflexota bacterium]
MHVNLVGINHRTAPIAIREKAAIRTEELHDTLSLLGDYMPHGIILSTCNRTEIYSIDTDGRHAEEASLSFLKAHLNTADNDLYQYLYVFKDETAVEHLFHVASGLDSMIIGEFEVLGQVRKALSAAEKARLADLRLRHLFQSAVRTGRRVREETGISKNALSVSSVAVDQASRIIGDLNNCQILVIGAGEAGRLVAKAAKDRGVSRIVVASRTEESASALAAELGGKPASMNNLEEEMSTCNMVVTCADAPRSILDTGIVEDVMLNRPELPMVIIDIAIPRNVAPAVAQINNVFLHNIDDLTQISGANRQQREGEIRQSDEIVADELARFISWQHDFEVRPVVRALTKKAEKIRTSQLNSTLKKLRLVSDEDRHSLEMMTKAIVSKILQNPIQYLKTQGNTNGDYAEIIDELFQLDADKS